MNEFTYVYPFAASKSDQTNAHLVENLHGEVANVMDNDIVENKFEL